MGGHVLRELRPGLVHQHYWQGLWWMMEAAMRLGIPTVYSAHDYGIACLRTILVSGWDTSCDGGVLWRRLSNLTRLAKLQDVLLRLRKHETIVSNWLFTEQRNHVGSISGSALSLL